MDAFERYCTPKANESVDRHIFFTRSQQPGESFELFITDLKKLSIPCGTLYGLIKDRIISGLQDMNLKNRLLREDDLDLDKCVKICKAFELAQQQLKTLSVDTQIHTVSKQEAIHNNWNKRTVQGKENSVRPAEEHQSNKAARSTA